MGATIGPAFGVIADARARRYRRWGAVALAVVAAVAIAQVLGLGPGSSRPPNRQALVPRQPSRGDARVAFRAFSIVVPNGWVWRAFPGLDGRGAEFSNWTLAGRSGFSPDAAMASGKFFFAVMQLGEYGSVTKPTIRRSDFLRLNDPARPRGHAHASTSFCARSGRCFSIWIEYSGNYVPDHILRAVNRTLATIRVAPLSAR